MALCRAGRRRDTAGRDGDRLGSVVVGDEPGDRAAGGLHRAYLAGPVEDLMGANAPLALVRRISVRGEGAGGGGYPTQTVTCVAI